MMNKDDNDDAAHTRTVPSIMMDFITDDNFSDEQNGPIRFTDFVAIIRPTRLDSLGLVCLGDQGVNSTT